MNYNQQPKPGNLFVLSAPSGSGKTTLLKIVMSNLDNLLFSVSHTTRPPRVGEVNGDDYHFVSMDEFKEMLERGEFLEWAEVHGNFYGTSRGEVEKKLSHGVDIVLDIDVQGAAIIRANEDIAASYIFVMPPTKEELERRLRGRGTDAEEIIQLRINNSIEEMRCSSQYDYIVINDDLDNAAKTLESIVVATRSKVR